MMPCYCAEMTKPPCAHCRCVTCGRRFSLNHVSRTDLSDVDERAAFTCLRCLNDLRRKESKPVILV